MWLLVLPEKLMADTGQICSLLLEDQQSIFLLISYELFAGGFKCFSAYSKSGRNICLDLVQKCSNENEIMAGILDRRIVLGLLAIMCDFYFTRKENLYA